MKFSPAFVNAAPRPHRQHGAFSLIEILVVVAIIGIVLTLGAPIVSGIGASRGVTQAAYDVTALLEAARTEAVTRQTYVWVGFESTTVGNSLSLQMGAVYSKDGTPDLTATNLQPLGRVLIVQNVFLDTFASLNGATRSLLNSAQGTPTDVENSGATFAIGKAKFDSGVTITFTPEGQAMVMGAPAANDGFDRLLAIGLRDARGTVALDNGNDAAVLLDGSIAVPRILRAR